MEDMFIETGTFGPKIVEQVLSGSHYVRAFTGMLMIGDALSCLLWEAFLSQDNQQKHMSGCLSIKKLHSALTDGNREQINFNFAEASKDENVKNLILNFEEFISQCCSNSELCRYLVNVQEVINLIKNLVKVDRVGDFLLHIKTVGELLLAFRAMDGIHYYRYGSFHFEIVKGVKDDHPSLYITSSFFSVISLLKQHQETSKQLLQI